MISSKNWITAGTDKPFYVRRELEIAREIEKATARVCGLGQFNFFVNGSKVSDDVLDPGWTDYRKAVYYLCFDVTPYLKKGTNALGAEIGNGWYIMEKDFGYSFAFPPFMPPNPNPYRPFGKSLVFNLDLELTYKDGSTEHIESDQSFKVKEHGVVRSNVYGSEYIKGGLLHPDFASEGFDDSSWTSARFAEKDEAPEGELVEQKNPAVKVIEKYSGRLVRSSDGKAVYDLGQNISGLVSVKVRGRKGDVITLRPAEKLDKNGEIDQMAKNWMNIGNSIVYEIGQTGETEEIKSWFTYFAGRYFEADFDAENDEILSFDAFAISAASVRDGSFTCDDERFNSIYNLVEKTVEANMMSVHTDCPTIERFAWQEPNHLMAPSIFFMKDSKKLWEKFFDDMRRGQHSAKDTFRDFGGKEFYIGAGLIPSQAPCYIPNVLPVPGMGSFYDTIAWGSALILGLRWHYIFYADKEVVRQNYDACKRYFEYLLTKVNKDGFINHGLGDWGNPDSEYARENVETAFLYADCITLKWFASLCNEAKDEVYYDLRASSIKKNYNGKLLVKDENGKWCYRSFEHADRIVKTQACEALPLYWGLVPEECIEDVVESFRETLMEKNSFASGEIGLPYIIQTASRFGMNDIIARFITREEHPSYYAFVKDGETTLGEYWENNPRSHCHDMMGHIIEWYYDGIAGIKVLEPGFAKVSIEPYMPEGMNEFECSYKSPYGIIRVEGKRNHIGEVEYKIDVPKGIELIKEEEKVLQSIG